MSVEPLRCPIWVTFSAPSLDEYTQKQAPPSGMSEFLATARTVLELRPDRDKFAIFEAVFSSPDRRSIAWGYIRLKETKGCGPFVDHADVSVAFAALPVVRHDKVGGVAISAQVSMAGTFLGS